LHYAKPRLGREYSLAMVANVDDFGA